MKQVDGQLDIFGRYVKIEDVEMSKPQASTPKASEVSSLQRYTYEAWAFGACGTGKSEKQARYNLAQALLKAGRQNAFFVMRSASVEIVKHPV